MGVVERVSAFLTTWVERTQSAGILADWVIVILILFVLTLWIGSGCWASSIGEVRGHGPVKHFLLGLAAPGFYPVIILFALGVRKRRAPPPPSEEEQAKKQRKITVVGVPSASEKKAAAEVEAAQPKAVEKLQYGQEFFDELASEKRGGVGMVISYTGNKVRVSAILDVFPEVVSVEIEMPDGSRSKIRIPYAKIESCETP